MPVAVRVLEIAPCRMPCSLAGTARVTSACTAGPVSPQPST